MAEIDPQLRLEMARKRLIGIENMVHHLEGQVDNYRRQQWRLEDEIIDLEEALAAEVEDQIIDLDRELEP